MTKKHNIEVESSYNTNTRTLVISIHKDKYRYENVDMNRETFDKLEAKSIIEHYSKILRGE